MTKKTYDRNTKIITIFVVVVMFLVFLNLIDNIAQALKCFNNHETVTEIEQCLFGENHYLYPTAIVSTNKNKITITGNISPECMKCISSKCI